MFRSVALRIALAGAGAFALATVLLGIASCYIVDRALRAQLDDRIATEVSSLRDEYRAEGDRSLRQIIAQREADHAATDLGYALFDRAGRKLAGALAVAMPPRQGWQTVRFFDPPEGYVEPGRALVADVGPGRRLIVAADLDSVQDADRLVLIVLAVALGLTVAIGSLFSLALAYYLRRRLAVMATGAQAIVDGDLSQRIAVGRRSDELDQLAGAFNAMLDQIAKLLGNLHRVSGDVAHDLRQPLTRLRNRLERGLVSGDPRLAIEDALGQVDQVLTLFTSLLRLSEIEAGRLRAGFTAVDPSRLVEELGDSYQPAVEDGGRRLTVRAATTRPVRGDAELLSQALVNLLDNAQLHTSTGSTIELAVTEVGDRVVLSVDDDGPGIAAADRPRVLERFVRLEASRHRSGHGLGLSLAAAIAEAHGGRLVLTDNGPGLGARIELPA